MAGGNFLFNNARNTFAGTGATRLDLDSDTIKAMFVDHADDEPAAADTSIADIASAARVPAIASCPTLGTKTIGTVAVGVFDAADTTFTALSGDQSESLILFKDTGTESTSLLVARWETATGLPVTPNGGDVSITWSASGILSL